MLEISENNRDEIERELVALVLNKNEVINCLSIKPKYLRDKDLAKMLAYAIESYQKEKVVSPAFMQKQHEDFDTLLYVELLTHTFYYDKAWREQLNLAEESIIKYLKEDIIKVKNKELREKKIDYDNFMQQMKKLDEIKITKDSNVLTVKELSENIVEQKQIKFNKFKKMSKILKLSQNDLLVIGSMTGTGKTGFMLNLMSDLMTDYQCIYFNMEMSKPSIYRRLIAINSNIPVDNVNNPVTGYQVDLVRETIKSIADKGVIIEHQVNNLSDIRAVVSKKKDSSRHTVIFIDHLGLVRINGKTSLYEQMTEIMKNLRLICLEYDCTIIGASQLNRSAYNSEELSLSMLKDSGELENSARKIILLYRDKNSSKEDLRPLMNVDICKNDSGATGILKMQYDKVKQIFEEVSDYGR